MGTRLPPPNSSAQTQNLHLAKNLDAFPAISRLNTRDSMVFPEDAGSVLGKSGPLVTTFPAG